MVLDRNRGAAYLSVVIVGAGMFGTFLFLTYYMQQTLHYSPVMSGVAFLPMIAMVVLSANLSNVVLMPRFGPRPLVTVGIILAAGSLVWLTRIGVHSGYVSAVLGPLMVTGLGFGFTIAPSMNTGTFGVAPHDAGAASATRRPSPGWRWSTATPPGSGWRPLSSQLARWSAACCSVAAHSARPAPGRPPQPERPCRRMLQQQCIADRRPCGRLPDVRLARCVVRWHRAIPAGGASESAGAEVRASGDFGSCTVVGRER